MVVMVVAGEEDARVQGDGAPAGLASACGLASPRHPAPRARTRRHPARSSGGWGVGQAHRRHVACGIDAGAGDRAEGGWSAWVADLLSAARHTPGGE